MKINFVKLNKIPENFYITADNEEHQIMEVFILAIDQCYKCQNFGQGKVKSNTAEN